MKTVMTVLRKELLESTRDSNVLLYAIGFPLLLYPMLIWGVVQLLQVEAGVTESQPSRIAVDAPEPFRHLLARWPVELVPRGGSGAMDEETDAVLKLQALPGGALRAQLDWNSTRPRSRRAHALMVQRLDELREDYLQLLALVRGLPARSFLPPDVQEQDESPAGELALSALSRVLPVLLMVVLVLATLYPLVNVLVGERERGSLETTLVTAPSPFLVVLGKLLSVLVVAMGAVLGNALAITATLASMLPDLRPVLGMLTSRNPLALPLSVVAMGSEGLAVAGVLGLVVLPASSFKSAQNNGMLLGTVLLALSALALLPGADLGFGMALLPAGGTSLLLRASMDGTLRILPGLLVILGNLSLAAVAFLLCGRLLASEAYLFGGRLPRWLAWIGGGDD